MRLPKTFDVVIMGGGLAGLTFGIQLKKKRPETSILIVEQRKHPVPEVTYKVGESTICVGAGYFSDIIGTKEQLTKDHIIKSGLRYFFPFEDNSDITRRVELGGTEVPKYPSYQLDRGKFENTLREMCKEHHISFIDQTKVAEFDIDCKSHKLTLFHKEEDILATNILLQAQKVSCKWLIDASGRAGLIKRKLNLHKSTKHNANSVWFRINADINVDNWSRDPQWRARVPENFRKFDTNHLIGDGYWIWLIALPNNVTSIGLVTQEQFHPMESVNKFNKLLSWMKKHEPQLANEIEQNQYALLDFRGMKEFAQNIHQVFSTDRWCILGDAGIFIDPLYSVGSDLIAIANTLATKLVCRDLSGQSITDHVNFYNWFFLDFLFENTELHYLGFYPHWINSQSITIKITLDAVFYFCISDLLFFSDLFTDLEFMLTIKEELIEFNDWYSLLQQFLIKWAEIDSSQWSDLFIDLDKIFIYNHFSGLIKDKFYSPDHLLSKLEENIAICKFVVAELLKVAVKRLNSIDNDIMSNFPKFQGLLEFNSTNLIRKDLDEHFNKMWVKNIVSKIKIDIQNLTFD